jgi:hypothetical protein
MISRSMSFCAGLLLAGVASCAILADDLPQCRAHRPAHVTYGGLSPMHGFERDHRVPLCLGGDDTPGNVWYEPLAEALMKDIAEGNACRYACHAGPAAISSAREDFRAGNWRKWIEE